MEIRFCRSRRSVSASQLATSTSSEPSCTRTRPRVTLLRPLTQRRSDDLPEPDRPMSTRISPSLTKSEASWTATRLPVRSWMTSRPSPVSSSARASSGVGPKTTSTCSKRIAAVALIGSRLARLATGRAALAQHAVEDDGEDDDCEAGLDTQGDVHLVERAYDRLAKPAGTDECGDDDHGQ